MNPPTTTPCPTCGKPLPAGELRGLCPQCLLTNVLAATVNSSSEPTLPVPGAVPASPSAVRLHYFGDYELLDEIARGGMGVVYRARQVSLNRIVAVKMILSGQLAGEAEVKCFRLEAEAAANLQHPHIVAIHEIGGHEGRHYFSMDFIEGKNLAEHATARATPFSAREIAALVQQLAEAVHYAHQRGTLHRDLKPQNVLIDAQGQPHITDFGLAKRWDTTNPASAAVVSELTHTGAVMGSPSYMAPEQAAARFGDLGPATDVYSLGAILYQLLTGQPPHRGASALDTVTQVIAEAPTAPRKLKPEVPADLEIVCLKCLEKNPAHRYANARMFAEELSRFLDGQPILAKPAGASRKIWSWALRHPWAISGAASLVILGLGFCTYGLWQQTQYMAWLAAHPGEVPFPYWPALQKQELPDRIMLTILGVWLCSVGCFCDFELRRLARAPFTSARLGSYVAANLAFIGSCLFLTAKVVKIGVWADAPLPVMFFLIGWLQPVLWGGLQCLWQVLRALQQNHSGMEPPPDFLSMKPAAQLQMQGTFSYRRAIRANHAATWARNRKELSRGAELVGPLLTALVAFGIVSLALAPRERPTWIIGPFIAIVFVHCLAGVINPRWLLRATAFDRLTPNAVRFKYAMAAVTIGAMSALTLAATHGPGLLAAAGVGLAIGCGLVLWQRRNLRRTAVGEESVSSR